MSDRSGKRGHVTVVSREPRRRSPWSVTRVSSWHSTCSRAGRGEHGRRRANLRIERSSRAMQASPLQPCTFLLPPSAFRLPTPPHDSLRRRSPPDRYLLAAQPEPAPGWACSPPCSRKRRTPGPGTPSPPPPPCRPERSTRHAAAGRGADPRRRRLADRWVRRVLALAGEAGPEAIGLRAAAGDARARCPGLPRGGGQRGRRPARSDRWLARTSIPTPWLPSRRWR